jgi:hypothetical protein
LFLEISIKGKTKRKVKTKGKKELNIMVEDRKKYERGKKKKALWEVPMEGSHIGKRKKLKSKKKTLRNNKDC